MAIVITSEQTIPIDKPFKVSAGPGAGKTHWLISHIRNVVAHSRKLDVVKKVACITYTNVGTDTIVSRLDMGNDVVEVNTIHSFLYANVVKPYIHLVADEIGLMQGELVVIDDSNFKTEGIAVSLLKRMNKQWFNAKIFLKGLEGSYWHYENHQYTDYKPKHPQQYNTRNGRRSIGNAWYMEFKKWLWGGGYISFEDILYLSYLLINRYPNIYHLIKARYPYVFVDEFQDTVPFVMDLLSRLGNEGTIIGVVGDKAQSIYDFLGATVQQFNGFSVPGMQDYEIRGNRRSTKQIIDLLNVIRTDFSQDWLNGTEGMVPVLMVGDMLDCYQKSIVASGTDDIQSLAYPNILANSMRRNNGARDVEKILETDFDREPGRQLVVITLLKAVEFARMNDLRNAWHHLDIIERDRSKSIVMLRRLLDGYSKYKDGSLMGFYNFVISELQIKLQGFKAGSSKTFYETHAYGDAALGVKGGDSDDKHKTIHKSKGDEFENVYVILKDESDLDFMLTPNLHAVNSHRVYYVAVSRAKCRLFINVPSLSAANREKLKNIPISVF